MTFSGTFLCIYLVMIILASMAWTISPTNRYMNVSNVSWTPAGGSVMTVKGIQNATYDEGISTKKEGADFDIQATVSVRDWVDPTFTVETIDAHALYQQISGAKGTLAITFNDAYNAAAAGGGAKTYTMTQAQIQGRNTGQAYREYGKASITFGSISADGATESVSVTAV